MELNTFQEKLIFQSKPEIQNKDELAQSLMSLSMGLVSEVGELADVINKGVSFSDNLNLVDVIDEISDVFWYGTAMLKQVGVNAEDVLEANYLKLRQRFQSGEYEKNYRSEKLFFKDLIREP